MPRLRGLVEPHICQLNGLDFFEELSVFSRISPVESQAHVFLERQYK